MHIAVRVDATAALGWGHLKRCLALAEALRQRGATLHWVGRCNGPAVPALLAAQGWRWIDLPDRPVPDAADPQQDAADTLAALRLRRLGGRGPLPDAVIADHYRLDARWHQAIREATGAPIVVIDDLADRPLSPDLLIDHNLADDHRAKYRAVLAPGRLPGETPGAESDLPILGGPHFALIAAAYTRQPVPALRQPVQRIGLFMGGTDPAQHSAWVLQLLCQRLRWAGELHIASTSANPQLAALQTLAQQAGATLHVDLPDLAAFHAGCDLQIGAGGGALWERCCLGVPTLALVCADNQRQSVPRLAATGAVLGGDAIGQTEAQADALLAAVRRLIDNPAERQSLRRHALALVDGQGAGRVAERLLALASRKRPGARVLATACAAPAAPVASTPTTA